MKSRTIVLFVVASFLTVCGLLVIDAVRSNGDSQAAPLTALAQGQTPLDQPDDSSAYDSPVEPAATTPTAWAAPVVYPELLASSGPEQTVLLGRVYPDAIERTDDPAKYKFQVELTTRGAAVKRASLSEFNDRTLDEPTPLTLLRPLTNRRTIYPLANTALWVAPGGAEGFPERMFPLDRLDWQVVSRDGRNAVTFEAMLVDQATQQPSLRLTKTYRVQPGSYDLVCELTAENLSDAPLNTLMQMIGPAGLSREDNREDMRKIVAAYRQNEEIKTRLLTTADVRQAEREIERRSPEPGIFTQLKGLFSRPTPPAERLRLGTDNLMWTAATNKYFAAILRPVGLDLTTPGPVRFERAVYYDAKLMEPTPAEDAGAGSVLEVEPLSLAAANQDGSRVTLTFEMFLGPKDRSIFEAKETYRVLEFFQTIDFRGCCCPSSLIGPLAFGIIWLMKALYTLMGPLGNYGVVIIFLVVIVRLVLHPVTKRSQVSMMKMQKLGPKIQEIQKKYANNKQEMQRKTMEVYREMGASPVAGMLPMLLQMPIWIALWTAVYTSVDLRGQAFLPFWITDLSAPDHLFKFPFGLVIPYFGEYLNLLPLLMGGVMFVQQKLMPTSQASAQMNPQVAQQQKMMMIMLPLMFPLLLYHGPSGVNLYIMSSIGAGVIEQMVIRKHIREKEALEAISTVPATAKTGGKAKKKKPKPMYRFDKS